MLNFKPLRGGSWVRLAFRDCRSASRDRVVPVFAFDDDNGFRVVCLPRSQPNAQPPSEKDCHD